MFGFNESYLDNALKELKKRPFGKKELNKIVKDLKKAVANITALGRNTKQVEVAMEVVQLITKVSQEQKKFHMFADNSTKWNSFGNEDRVKEMIKSLERLQILMRKTNDSLHYLQSVLKLDVRTVSKIRGKK